MMDPETCSAEAKIFNLRLHVQRLEEELIFYRNGATTTELWEVIQEKDSEIETWRVKCVGNEEKLNRLVKSSGDVFLQINQKSEENRELQQEIMSLHEQLQQQTSDMQATERSAREFQTTIDSLRSELKARDDTIGALQLQVWESQQQSTQLNSQRENSLRELQSATEASQRVSLTLEQTLDSLRNDLNTAQKSLADKCIQLENSQKETIRWKAIVEEQDGSIDKLHKRCAVLVRERHEKMVKMDEEHSRLLEQVKGYQDNLLGQINDRSEAIAKKDMKIKDLMIEAKKLQHELRRVKSKAISSHHHAINNNNNNIGGAGAMTSQRRHEENAVLVESDKIHAKGSHPRSLPLGDQTNITNNNNNHYHSNKYANHRLAQMPSSPAI